MKNSYYFTIKIKTKDTQETKQPSGSDSMFNFYLEENR